MCVVVPHILARGPLRAPVQPPAVALVRALNPARASRPYRRSTTRRAWRRPSPPAPNHGSMGVSPPLETHSQGRCRSPLHPIDPFRRTEGAVAPPRNPATKEPSAPFGNLDQPSADWMRATFARRWITGQGAYRRPAEPSSSHLQGTPTNRRTRQRKPLAT